MPSENGYHFFHVRSPAFKTNLTLAQPNQNLERTSIEYHCCGTALVMPQAIASIPKLHYATPHHLISNNEFITLITENIMPNPGTNHTPIGHQDQFISICHYKNYICDFPGIFRIYFCVFMSPMAKSLTVLCLLILTWVPLHAQFNSVQN